MFERKYRKSRDEATEQDIQSFIFEWVLFFYFLFIFVAYIAKYKYRQLIINLSIIAQN